MHENVKVAYLSAYYNKSKQIENRIELSTLRELRIKLHVINIQWPTETHLDTYKVSLTNLTKALNASGPTNICRNTAAAAANVP